MQTSAPFSCYNAGSQVAFTAVLRGGISLSSGAPSDTPPASPSGMPDQPFEEAVPLAEQGQTSPYQPSPEVEALTPRTPEVLTPGSAPATPPSTSIDGPMVVVPAP